MSKKLYDDAPWTPKILRKAKKKKNNLVSSLSEEGSEKVDKRGNPKVGYSAYGLKITNQKNQK